MQYIHTVIKIQSSYSHTNISIFHIWYTEAFTIFIILPFSNNTETNQYNTDSKTKLNQIKPNPGTNEQAKAKSRR